MKCCQFCVILTLCLNSLRNRLLIFKPSPTKGVGRTTPTLHTSHAPLRLSQLLEEPCSTIKPWSFRIHQQKSQERRHKSITRTNLYMDSKHSNLNPNQKQHKFKLHLGFETSKLPCSTIYTTILNVIYSIIGKERIG